MIITDVKAENVLKYASLELHNLPEHGVIAIDGPNESGKSSLFDAVRDGRQIQPARSIGRVGGIDARRERYGICVCGSAEQTLTFW